MILAPESRRSLAIAAGVALGAGLAVPLAPGLALALGLGPLLARSLVRASFRVVVVVLGGVFALGAEALTPLKVAYFLVVGAVLAVDVQGLVRERHRNAQVQLEAAHFLRLSVPVGATLALSALTGLAAGSPPVNVARDIAPYLMLVAVPALALDAGDRVPTAVLQRLLVVAGLLSTTGFTVFWLERRELLSVPLDAYLFNNDNIGIALFCYACARVISTARRRTGWLALASLALALPLTSGTRAVLLYLLGPAAMAGVLLLRRRTDMLGRLVLAAAVLALLSGILFAGLLRQGLLDERLVAERLASITELTGGLERDASTNERLIQNRLALETLRDHPVLGVGPGHLFTWYGPSTLVTTVAFTLDTPLVTPAKFGVVASALLVLYLLSWSRLARDSMPRTDAWFLALVGYLTVTIATGLTAALLENKGFALAMVVLLAGTWSARAAPSEPPGGQRSRSGR